MARAIRKIPSWSLSRTIACVAVLLGACAQTPTENRTVVDDAALRGESRGENWLAYGRTYSEQRFSPLTEINDGNVAELGVDWYVDLPTDRDLSSTPLVVDGVMYFVGSMNVVRASTQRRAITPAGRGTGARKRAAAPERSAPKDIRMNWARRLKRVFGIEIEQCARCGGRLTVIASIEEPELIERILAHRRERGEEAPSTASLGARAPPQPSLF